MMEEEPVNERFETYEQVLDKIGQFGPWQKKLIVLLWIPPMLAGIGFMQYNFAVGTPTGYRCLIPHCESHEDPQSSPVTFNTSWLSHFTSSAISCSMHQPVLPEETRFKCETLASIPLEANPQACQSYVYSTDTYSSTAVTEFDLVCEKNHLKSLIGMGDVASYGVGASIIGSLSDNFGRKKAILLSVAFVAFFHTLSSFATHYWLYAFFQWSAALFNVGLFVVPFVATVELVGFKYSALSSIIINLPFVAGELLLIAISYHFRNFRTMLRVAFVPAFAILGLWFFLPESPRWLISQNRISEAKVIILKAAKDNGHHIDEASLDSLSPPREAGKEGQKISSYVSQFKALFTNKCMRKRLLLMYVEWVCVVLGYNGLTLNSVNLGGSPHVNMAIGVAIEIPSYLFAAFTLDKLGRKPILVWTQIMSGLACLATLLVPASYGSWPIVALSSIGKFATSAAFAVVFLQVSEMFPTSVRSTALGTCSLWSRIGGVMAPLLTNLQTGKALPLLIIGVSSLVAGLAGCFLPETAGQPLPESVEEAEKSDKGFQCRELLCYK